MVFSRRGGCEESVFYGRRPVVYRTKMGEHREWQEGGQEASVSRKRVDGASTVEGRRRSQEI